MATTIGTVGKDGRNPDRNEIVSSEKHMYVSLLFAISNNLLYYNYIVHQASACSTPKTHLNLRHLITLL